MLILYLYVDEKKIYFLKELSDFVIDVKYGRFFYYCHKSLDLPGDSALLFSHSQNLTV